MTGRVLVDLHTHSTCSADGRSSLDGMARRAEALGLAELGLCEHADFDPRDSGCRHLDVARYDRELAAARAAARGVRVRQGVEITYQAAREAELRAWTAAHDWDYVVASVHLVDYPDGWAIVSEPAAVGAYFATRTEREAYAPYFDELRRAAASGIGDVLGHFDLIKRYSVERYGPFEPLRYEEEIRAVLRAAIGAGVGLEINTSGLRQGPGEPYPGPAVLRWYRDMGGDILSAGSDAHDVEHLGAGIPEALDMARAAGFGRVASFARRRVRWIRL